MAVSIQTSLTRHFLLLIIGVSATILGVLTWSTRRVVDDLSQKLTTRSMDQTEDAMQVFFGPIESLLQSSRSWWELGLIRYENKNDLTHLNSLFMPVLDQYPHITSMMVATDEGFEYLLFRDTRGGDHYEWYNRVVWVDRGAESGFEVRWTKEMEVHSEGPLPPEIADYDPRTRLFYVDAPYDSIYWTDPYYFFISKDAGITACFKWRDPDSQQVRLVGFDLMLKDLSQFTTDIHPSENGKVFVTDSEGSILGLPFDPRWSTSAGIDSILSEPVKRAGAVVGADDRAQLLSASDLKLPAVDDAIENLTLALQSGSEFSRYSSDGADWLADARPYQVGTITVWIGVISPESDYLHHAIQQRNFVLAVCFLAIIAGVAAAFTLSRKYSRPLKRLAKQSAKVRTLNLADKEYIKSGLKEVDQLSQAQANMITALESFSRYVPLDLVRELIDRGEVAQIGGRVQVLTVLFTDIEDFTKISEELDPQALTELMAEYFEALLKILHEHGATTDKLIGDSIMAFWGAPQEDPSHAINAVDAALRCQRKLIELNEDWQSRGLPVLKTRFGMSSGDTVVGNVGSRERLNYTALGDTVNQASRVESVNKFYGTEILVTHMVKDFASDKFEWRFIDEAMAKGKSKSAKLYEPLGKPGEVSLEVLELKEGYERALELYREGNFESAKTRLDQLQQNAPGDGPSLVLNRKCSEFIKNPPGENWSFVSVFERK